MKKVIVAFAILLFPLSASALTQEQAVSLINVVRSSPETPASAFTSLITAFSTVTETQANTLIVLVQAAPTAPAEAFVNLLTAFAPDIPVVTETQTPTQTTSPAQTTQAVTTSVTSTPVVAGVVEQTPISNGKIVFSDPGMFGNDNGQSFGAIDAYYYEGDLTLNVPITFSSSDGGVFHGSGIERTNPLTENPIKARVTGYKWRATVAYYPTHNEEIGAIITRNITVSANGISLTRQVKFAIK